MGDLALSMAQETESDGIWNTTNNAQYLSRMRTAYNKTTPTNLFIYLFIYFFAEFHKKGPPNQ